MSKKIITKEQMIKGIVKESKVDLNSVRLAYNCLESKIKKLLSETSYEQNVKIKLFEGITVEGTYVPQSVKINNLTGKKETYAAKIRPSIKVSRRYCEKLNNKIKSCDQS